MLGTTWTTDSTAINGQTLQNLLYHNSTEYKWQSAGNLGQKIWRQDTGTCWRQTMKELTIVITTVLLLNSALMAHCSTAEAEQFLQPLLINADNIQELATVLDKTFKLEGDVMCFGPFDSHKFETLIEIPLGTYKPEATIQITMGLDPTGATNKDDHCTTQKLA